MQPHGHRGAELVPEVLLEGEMGAVWLGGRPSLGQTDYLHGAQHLGGHRYLPVTARLKPSNAQMFWSSALISATSDLALPQDLPSERMRRSASEPSDVIVSSASG